MSFGHALYYPYINLTNKNWIKHALLFWEQIHRIVPKSYEPIDSEEIIKIKEETDFIKDYHPGVWDTSNTFSEFSNILPRIIETDTFFNDRFFRSTRGNRNYMRDFRNRQNLFLDIVEGDGSYIHVEKMDERTRNLLFDYGLAIQGRHEWESWIKIDGEIGMLYMTYFAKSISKNTSRPIVTDIESSFSSGVYFESQVNSDYRGEFEYRLGNLLIQTVVPKNINDVSLDKLLAIRVKYNDERSAFFNEISSLTQSITQIDNSTALEDAISIHSKLLLKQTADLEKLYKSYKIDAISKFLSVSVPTTIVGISEVSGILKPFITAGGVLFGLFSAANSVKKDRLELNNNPKSYLLNLKSELSSQQLFDRINDKIKGLRKE